MDEVSAILIGSILGDGSLTPLSVRRAESQLHLGYHERSLPYLEWLHGKLRPLGLNPIRAKRGYRQYHSYSKPSRFIGQFRRIFYQDGVKVVPEQINDLLVHPVSLAVWYMDDGSLDFRAGDHANASIATYNFSEHDCLRLSKVLLDNFGLRANVHRSTMRGKIYYRLYFLSENMEEFMALIGPFIQPCFAYKLLSSASSRGKT